VERTGSEAVLENFAGELVRRHEVNVIFFFKQKTAYEIGTFQQTQFLQSWREQLQPGVGAKNAHGMRLECYCYRFGMLLLCAPDHFVDDVNVGAVHAVEVSDTQHGGAEVSRNVFEFAKDLYGPTLHVG